MHIHKQLKIIIILLLLLSFTAQQCYAMSSISGFFFRKPSKCNLNASWDFYKKKFISADGRVIDYQIGSITTSEGQAYAMRRALMINDDYTFDKVYDWTKNNLKRKEDNLFAWKWGENKGEFGILDKNTASDADIEIAAALISASKNFHKGSYLSDAKKIIKDIWNKETVEFNGKRILTSGVEQAKDPNRIEVNPSYFMPDSFKIFARVDKSHDWRKIVDSSYELVDYCVDNIKSGLPPDWFYIDRKTGKISFEETRSDFSYDAIRVFYRFYLDYKINNDKRAKKLLSKANLFINRWKKDKKFYTEYKRDGKPKSAVESVGCIALLLPVLKIHDSKVAEEIYKNKVERNYNKAGYWDDPDNYYTQNLAWFGSWLYLDEKNIKSFKY